MSKVKGISQVAIAVNEMDSVTQQNSVLVEESSRAVLSLQEQAVILEEIVATFNLITSENHRLESAAVTRPLLSSGRLS
ncbi:MAG: Methyl-accepting chemotaxis protein III [Candidatus Erwinia impunctatus]|nr:Methyl-accepting chemotaxis protein III [Culicoides impunctatus]